MSPELSEITHRLNVMGANGRVSIQLAREVAHEAFDLGRAASTRPDVIAAILDAWYERYRQAGRINEDVFLSLRNRLIPLAPGEPVQFLPYLRHGDVDPAKRRWLNGYYEGPVLNPDDPYRPGDVIVVATSGRRVPVFLSSVRRRS